MCMGEGIGRRSPAIERIVASSRSYVPTTTERDFYHKLIVALAARRRALGLSQEALDRRLGNADGLVAKWESFARVPGPFMMVCWASTLGVRFQVMKDEVQ